MTTKTFSPHSRQQDERVIVRAQRDFSAGMFDDLPATNIPNNGVAYLKNIKNYGGILSGRTGSKIWGDEDTYTECADLPTYDTGIKITNTVINEVRTITFTGANTTTNVSVGDYIIFETGIHERVSEILSSTKLTTQTTNPNVIVSLTCSLRHQVNALYYHNILKKIFLHIGTDIYIARDIVISSWDKIYCESIICPSNTTSLFDSINNKVVLINDNGIFKIDATNHPDEKIFYYKINSLIPQSKLTTPDPNTGIYIRRYVYGLSKLSDGNITRDRQTTGVLLETDSGTNIIDPTTGDVTEYFSIEPVSNSAPNIISGFDVPTIVSGYKESHWTHYSLWGTLDAGVSGTDALLGTGNDPERFIWIDDVPIMKVFSINSTSGSPNLEIVSGDPKQTDSFSDINIMYGSSFITKTLNQNIANDFIDITTNMQYTIASGGAFIGAASGAMITASGGIISPITGTPFTAFSIGKKALRLDGSYLHIIGVSGVSGISVETETISTPEPLCWGESTRRYYDTFEDTNLAYRIGSYPLFQRLYTSLPDTDLGIVVPGWLFVTDRKSNNLYYSQIADGYEELTGYHHPTYQETFIKDGITAFGEIENNLLVYCQNSTYSILLNDIGSIEIPDLGVSISTIKNVTPIDSTIGVINYSSVANLDNGRQIMITNEPAIRICDGKKFSNNLASQKLTNLLRTFQASTIATYTPFMGYTFWGNDE